MRKLVSFAALFCVLAASALAQGTAPAKKAKDQTPGVDKRQEKQQKRIDKGVEKGKITSEEQQKLQAGQDKIASDKAAAKADGTVTEQERKQLHKELNKSSRDIARAKGNKKKS
jgi:uncharacterized membrane protein YebE (DUF533 family)